MLPPIRVTEADLRQAMRDPRYWRSFHPERDAFVGWVTEGFRGLYPRDAAPRQSVWVRAYMREGHPVAAHWRGAPDRGSAQGSPGQGRRPMPNGGEAEPDVIPANMFRFLEMLRRAAPGGRGGGRPGTQSPRVWRGRDGRDRVDEIRSDPATQRLPDAHNGVPQHSRPGGEAGRQSDLERLRPSGPGVERAPGKIQYLLEDGRMAMTRQATHRNSSGEPTIEVFEPIPGSRAFRPVDLFRYPLNR